MADQTVKFVFIAATAAHILAIDSSGLTWWRRWDKKGWQRMENPTISVSDPSPSNNPTPTAPIPIIPPVAAPAIPIAINAPSIVPHVSLSHQDPA